MNTVLIIIGIVSWYVIGVYSFYYWWTKDYDLTDEDLVICFFAGFVGIGSWFIGRSLHKDLNPKENNRVVIFPKKENKK